MRAALKIAGYRDQATPHHNEEVGACSPRCECGHEHTIARRPKLAVMLDSAFEESLDREIEQFERGVEMRRDYEFEGRVEQFDRAVGIVNFDRMMRENSNPNFS